MCAGYKKAALLLCCMCLVWVLGSAVSALILTPYLSPTHTFRANSCSDGGLSQAVLGPSVTSSGIVYQLLRLSFTREGCSVRPDCLSFKR